ncbi:MAG TPA: Ig-like domain-containing protein [Syntrophomonadaceae bacterium]|nr:Ig-like domain-containing protein [Syntrophomonadaceae bacterium]
MGSDLDLTKGRGYPVRQGYKRKLLIFVMMVLLIFQTLPAMAGQGDGSGGGQDQSLLLVTSSPANGAKEAALDTQIKLTFNKNVVNMSVQANNRGCFTLLGGGKAVAITVKMADDQVQPEGKRDIILVPQNPLTPGTSYRVTIASGLQAKSGSLLGQAVSLSFTTMKPPGSSVTASDAPGGDNPTTTTSQTSNDQKETAEKAIGSPNMDSAADKTSVPKVADQNQTAEDLVKGNPAGAEQTPLNTRNGNQGPIIGLLGLAFLACVIIYVIKGRGK